MRALAIEGPGVEEQPGVAGRVEGSYVHWNMTLLRRALRMTNSSIRIDARCGLRVIDFHARMMRRSTSFVTDMLEKNICQLILYSSRMM